MTHSNLKLRFGSSNVVELYESEFRFDAASPVLSCIRGKSAGAYRNFGSFHWTSAVKAMAILALEYKLSFLARRPAQPLVGERSSLASSLDYALSKETNWLSDMFGFDAHGRLLAKRLFHRTNSNRKRPGPVALAINYHLLDPESVIVELDGKKLLSAGEVADLRMLLTPNISSDVADQVSTIALAA